MSYPRRVTFGPEAFLAGAAITVVIFGIPYGITGYVFGIPAAIVLGVPLALAFGLLMRPVRPQLLHVAAIGAAGLITGLVTIGNIMGWAQWHSMWGIVLWTGFCAAVGRLAVAGLVKTHDDGGLPAGEPEGHRPEGHH